MSETIVGRTIAKVRESTTKEQRAEHWDRPFVVVELDNGVKLYASRDDEGNGPGTLFGRDKKNKGLYITAEE